MNVAPIPKNLPGREKPARGGWLSQLQVLLARRILRRCGLRWLSRPRVLDGRALDPQLQRVLWISGLGKRKALHMLAVPAARREYRLMRTLFEDPILEPQVDRRTIDGPAGPIAIQIYGTRGERTRPGVVYFHGGGGVIGDLWTHDGVCRRLALDSGLTVISVDYRLAPEHRFPAGHDDAVAAFRWVAQHAASLGLAADRIAVAGDSMGGNLAAGVCLSCTQGPRPALALLVYPGTDFAARYASQDLFAEGFMLADATVDWFHAHYLRSGRGALGGADPADPRASVLRAAGLGALPPVHVVTAGFDPLRDEGQAFAAAVASAGGTVVHREYPSLIHGFMQMTGVCAAARAASRDLGDVLRRGLGGV